MNKSKFYSINESFEKIKEAYKRIDNKPLLIGVHSPAPNSGKTYFCKKASEFLNEEGRFRINGTKKHDFNLFSQLEEDLDYLFYEIGINCIDEDYYGIKYWNKMIAPFAKRNIDLNLMIFNPNMAKPNLNPLSEIFDIIIANPDSIKKNFSDGLYANYLTTYF